MAVECTGGRSEPHPSPGHVAGAGVGVLGVDGVGDGLAARRVEVARGGSGETSEEVSLRSAGQSIYGGACDTWQWTAVHGQSGDRRSYLAHDLPQPSVLLRPPCVATHLPAPMPQRSTPLTYLWRSRCQSMSGCGRDTWQAESIKIDVELQYAVDAHGEGVVGHHVRHADISGADRRDLHRVDVGARAPGDGEPDLQREIT